MKITLFSKIGFKAFLRKKIKKTKYKNKYKTKWSSQRPSASKTKFMMRTNFVEPVTSFFAKKNENHSGQNLENKIRKLFFGSYNILNFLPGFFPHFV